MSEHRPESTLVVRSDEGEVVTVPHSPACVVPPPALPPLPPSPAVIILRGISGSGKSSLAKHFQSLALASHPPPSPSPPSSFALHPSPLPTRLICSADAFFIHRGVYRFDSKLLSAAHAHCFAHFLSLVAARAPYVIVDNTNVERWQWTNYARTAELMGYAVAVVEVRVRGDEEVAVCAERNQHGVPLAGVAGMVEKWEDEPSAVVVDAVWTDEERARLERRRREKAERAERRAQALQQQPMTDGYPQPVDPVTTAIWASAPFQPQPPTPPLHGVRGRGGGWAGRGGYLGQPPSAYRGQRVGHVRPSYSGPQHVPYARPAARVHAPRGQLTTPAHRWVPAQPKADGAAASANSDAAPG